MENTKADNFRDYFYDLNSMFAPKIIEPSVATEQPVNNPDGLVIVNTNKMHCPLCASDHFSKIKIISTSADSLNKETWLFTCKECTGNWYYSYQTKEQSFRSFVGSGMVRRLLILQTE